MWLLSTERKIKGRFFAVLILFAAGLTACRIPEYPEPELIEQAKLTFDTAEVIRDTLIMEEIYPGSLAPDYSELYFEAAGQIDEVNVYTGLHVSAGDVLMTLDHTATEERIADIKDEIENINVQADFDDRAAELERQYLLTELERIEITEGKASLNFSLKSLEIEDAENRHAQVISERESTLASLRAELESLLAELGRQTVTAPHEGYVYIDPGIRHGVYAKNGGTVCTVIDTRGFELMIDTYISPGDFERCAAYALIEGRRYPVKQDVLSDDELAAMYLSGEPVRGAFFVEDPENTLTAGLYGVLVLERIHEDDVLQIPSNAILKDSGGAYVYRIVEGDHREKTYIKTGATNYAMTVVVEGLKEGEKVYVPE